MAKLEIEQSDQAKALFAQLAEGDRTLVRKVLTIIDSAPLMPEQSLLVQLGVLEELLTAVKEGARVSAVIGEPEAFAQRAIAEIGEDVRRDRHIGALMGGIAICAIVLLALSAVSLVKGLIAGVSFMQITTSLNLGHVLCFICVLAGVRFFVMGDKNADYNAPQKARKRTQLVGVLFILGFICLLAAIFVELPVVLTVQAVYIFALALVLILAWKLSSKI